MQRGWDAGEPLHDVSPGRWLKERLWSWGPGSARQGLAVGCFVPAGFGAYARLLHPAHRDTDDGRQPVRWSDVASWEGTTAHPLMQFHRVAKLPWPDIPDWGNAPSEGTLPPAEGDRLVAILRAFRSTPNLCYLALWEGYGVSELNVLANRPRLILTHRNYFLFVGALDNVMSMSVGDFHQPPNLWWPRDQTWCVATDIDSNATYIAGSAACVDRIISDPNLEAFPISVDARIDFDGDTINPRA
jgi:hypothetical protein